MFELFVCQEDNIFFRGLFNLVSCVTAVVMSFTFTLHDFRIEFNLVVSLMLMYLFESDLNAIFHSSRCDTPYVSQSVVFSQNWLKRLIKALLSYPR